MTVKLELFTANICRRCVKAKTVVSTVVAELGEEHFELEFTDVVKNLDHAVASGVLLTPTLMVDGKVLFSPLPSKRQVYASLKTRMSQ